MSKSSKINGPAASGTASRPELQEERVQSPGKAFSKDKPHYAGHRERLRKRFNTVGAEGLADYELLELFLFRSLPRQDTKPLAKALLRHFGSLEAVFAAPRSRLMQISGIGQSIITDLKLISAITASFSKSKLEKKPVLDSWPLILEYCRKVMAFEEREQVRALFLNKKNALIADEVLHTGTVDHTPLYPREIVKRALELSATGLILAHNHPSGDPTPSKADIETTKRILEATRQLNIKLHDHIIIGKNGCSSFLGLNLLN